MKRLALIAFVLISAPVDASPAHCSHDGMKTWHVCHICQKGRWYDIKEYECSAREEARQERAMDRQIRARYHHE